LKTIKDNPSFVSFGDSITHGSHLSNLSQDWAYLTAQNLSLPWINVAQSGAEVTVEMQTYIQNISGYSPSSTIVFMAGTNDAFQNSTNHAEFVNDYKKLVENATKFGYSKGNIYLTSIPWTNNTDYMAYLPEFDDLVKQVATDESVNFVNMTPYLEGRTDYLASPTGSDSPYLHPNAKGHEEMASLITQYIETKTLPPLPQQNSCKYPGSGNWNISASDFCNITANVNLKGNSILISGNGTVTLLANVTNFSSISVSGIGSSGTASIICTTSGCFR
jgi:lysophospholipase L1-like esterase